MPASRTKSPSDQPEQTYARKKRQRKRQREVIGYTPERIYTALAQADEQTRLQVLALLRIDNAIIL